MTLVLVWETIKGISVVADTRFTGRFGTGADGGPKIFSVPIVLNKPVFAFDTEKCRLPSMGFSFAGDTSIGQTLNAVASACLQNLLAPNEFDDGPTVSDVAALYGRCAVLVLKDRRKWSRGDIQLDGLVFGRSSPNSSSQVFLITPYIDADGEPQCRRTELDLRGGKIAAIGSGSARVQEVYEELNAAPVDENSRYFSPLDALRAVMNDPEVPSVGGHQQFAVATRTGVELQPGLRDPALRDMNPFQAFRHPLIAEGIEDYQIMGFDMKEIGSVGEYHPTANSFTAS